MQGLCSLIFRIQNRLPQAIALTRISQCASFQFALVLALVHFVTSIPFKIFNSSSWHIRILCASLALVLGQSVLAAVEDNRILALEPLEGMVVVETAAGKLEVISIGDVFPDSDVVVVQVLADKVVAQEVVGGDKKITQQVWVYKAENADAGSRVERLLLNLPHNGTLVPNTQGTHPVASDSSGDAQ